MPEETQTTLSCLERHAIYNVSMSIKLKRPISVSAEAVKRFLQSASHAAGRGDLVAALEILGRARSLAPGDPDILLQLGLTHGLNFDYTAAGEHFEKAVHFSTQKTLTISKAGSVAHSFYNLDLAERYLRLATKQKDAAAATWLRLARFLEGTRRFPDSAQCLEQVCRLDPSLPEIPLMRAKLERQANRWEEAEKLLRSVPPASEASFRVEYTYELADVLDRQGRHEEAMAAYLEAKAPFQRHLEVFRPSREAFYGKRRRVIGQMSAKVLERWFDAGPQLEPARRLAILCGHPRSGTTLLEQVLDSHPDIVAAEETLIFRQDVCVPLLKCRPPEPDSADPAAFQLNLEALEAAPVDLLRRLRENYFSSMERCLGEPIAGRLVVDKNPMLSMLFLCGAPRVFPEAKFLVALRDPRDVCLSCFMQHLPRHIDVRRTAYFNLSSIVEHYVEEMTLWQKLAPIMAGRYLEVRYEDMVDDLESVARKTLEFLDVSWDPGVLGFHERAQRKVFGHKNYRDVSKPVYQRARQRWRNYEKYFEPHQEKLAPFVKAFGYD